MRGVSNNTAPNISSTANSSNSTSLTKCDTNSKIQDLSINTESSKERDSSFSQLNLDNNKKNCTLSSLDFLLSVDPSNEILVDYYEQNNKIQNSFDNISP